MSSSQNEICVSVVIPFYNVEKYLKDCVQSIMAQTLKNIEIICVNDGSTDNSRNIILDLQKEDERIVLVDQENRGVSAARNAGVDRVRGKYISFIDSDDMLEPEALEVLFEKAESENFDMVDYNRKFLFEEEFKEHEERVNNKLLRKKTYDGVFTGPELFFALRDNKEFYVSVCFHLINTDFYRRSNLSFIEGIIHEDNAFVFSLYMNAKKCSLVPEEFYIRRVRPGSITRTQESGKNVYGYFRSMMVVKQSLSTYVNDGETYLGVQKFFHSLFRNTFDVFYRIENPDMSGYLKDDEANEFYMLKTLYEIEVLKQQKSRQELNKRLEDRNAELKSSKEENLRLLNQVNELKKANASLEKNLNSFKKSRSYRIGRLITWLPRKILSLFRKRK